jgi:hypothetical protein
MSIVVKKREKEGLLTDFNLNSMLEFTINCELNGTSHKRIVENLILELFVPHMQNLRRKFFPQECS